MKEYFYYNVIRKSTIQFLDSLNDIKIAKYNSDGTIRKYINVPLKFSPKDKNYAWLFSKNRPGYKDKRILILPQMSVQLTGIDYDNDRQVNKESNIMISQSTSASTLTRELNPVPYNINYELSIYTKNIDEINQIVEQILPYFSPEVFLRLNIPQLQSTMDLKLIYLSSSPDMNPDIDESNYRIIKWDMSFVLQAYLFKPLEITPMIKEIMLPYYLNKTNFDNRINTKSPTGASFIETINNDGELTLEYD